MEGWSGGGCRGSLTNAMLQHSSRPSRPSTLNALSHPLEVTPVSLRDRQHEELRRVIGMFAHDKPFERRELCLLRLEDDQHLSARLEFALPPVMRFDLGNHI